MRGGAALRENCEFTGTYAAARSRDGTDNSGRSTTAQRVLRDDTDELQISTSGRRHRRDVTSPTPKRTSVNACECVQRVCNKEQYKHACDKKTDTDYAPVSRHVVTSGRRHRHSSVSSSSDSDSKHPRLSSDGRQSRCRRLFQVKIGLAGLTVKSKATELN